MWICWVGDKKTEQKISVVQMKMLKWMGRVID